MPWKETSVMEEGLGFVARLLECEGMNEVCQVPEWNAASVESLRRSNSTPACPRRSAFMTFDGSLKNHADPRLGIEIEPIKPGPPQQNDRHERMHLALKKQTTHKPGMNTLQQQAHLHAFLSQFNHERPHEAIAMQVPANLCQASRRPYQGLPEIEYPFHDRHGLVTNCGRICLHPRKINIATLMAGQRLAIKQVGNGIWRVSFMCYELAYIDLEQRTLKPIENPSATSLSHMS